MKQYTIKKIKKSPRVTYIIFYDWTSSFAFGFRFFKTKKELKCNITTYPCRVSLFPLPLDEYKSIINYYKSKLPIYHGN